MSQMQTSIFPVLLLMVGVSVTRHISSYASYEESDTLQPIMTRSQQRKMCAELCMAGLGGTPCGEDCVDLVPQDMPLQFNQENATVNYSVFTRHRACDLLCENNLGYPLCGCRYDQSKTTDYEKVCSHYCLEYEYEIYGCQKCSVYNSSATGAFSMQSLSADDHSVDWNLWCVDRCQKGDGGIACNFCSYYCHEHDYQIYGCQKCSVYNSSETGPFSMQSLTTDDHPINWMLWCTNMCQEGNGGAACDCDLLPMGLSI